MHEADGRAFAERCKDDRHHFRFIVSPDDAGELENLRTFTRELMDQASRDLGSRLDWVAMDMRRPCVIDRIYRSPDGNTFTAPKRQAIRSALPLCARG